MMEFSTSQQKMIVILLSLGQGSRAHWSLRDAALCSSLQSLGEDWAPGSPVYCSVLFLLSSIHGS